MPRSTFVQCVYDTQAFHLWRLSVHAHASSDPTRNGTLLLIEFVGSSQCTVGSRLSNLPFTYLSDDWRVIPTTNIICTQLQIPTNERTIESLFGRHQKYPAGRRKNCNIFCVRLGRARTTRWCHSSFFSLVFDSVWLTKFPFRECAGRGSEYRGGAFDSSKRVIFEHHPGN